MTDSGLWLLVGLFFLMDVVFVLAAIRAWFPGLFGA